MTIEERFRTALRELRKAMGMTQSDLADALKARGQTQFHTTTVSRVEKGERQVSLSEAEAIADILGLKLADLIAPGGADLVEERQRLIELVRDLSRRVDEAQAQLVDARRQLANVDSRLELAGLSREDHLNALEAMGIKVVRGNERQLAPDDVIDLQGWNLVTPIEGHPDDPET